MKPIHFIDRCSGMVKTEKVYGAGGLKFIYGGDFISRIVGLPLLHALVKTSFFSSVYGFWQKLRCSKKKIIPFIKDHEIDVSEFAEEPSSFHSFNDFFIRHLKPSARPIAQGSDIAIIPADGRYYFYQQIDVCDGFIVKGKKFSLADLLKSDALAQEYSQGSMVIARLCPSDYHRFHFPCEGTPSTSRLINGWLYSVNPIAIKKNLSIFTQNKRTICEIESESFGKVIYIDVGATCVGSINQTYEPDRLCAKGDEKGYFSFGGSSLILLFLPGSIKFDEDLLNATKQGMEIRCLMGQPMGTEAQEAEE